MTWYHYGVNTYHIVFMLKKTTPSTSSQFRYNQRVYSSNDAATGLNFTHQDSMERAAAAGRNVSLR